MDSQNGSSIGTDQKLLISYTVMHCHTNLMPLTITFHFSTSYTPLQHRAYVSSVNSVCSISPSVNSTSFQPSKHCTVALQSTLCSVLKHSVLLLAVITIQSLKSMKLLWRHAWCHYSLVEPIIWRAKQPQFTVRRPLIINLNYPGPGHWKIDFASPRESFDLKLWTLATNCFLDGSLFKILGRLFCSAPSKLHPAC